MNQENKIILALDIESADIVAVVAKRDFEGKIEILGAGKSLSSGFTKGSITDIEQTSKDISSAISIAKSSFDAHIDETYIALSDIHTKTSFSIGATNIPNGQVSSNDIKLVLTRAMQDVQLIPDYEIIHVIPSQFTLDDNNKIDNPFNMNGSRLEVHASVVMAKKSALINIKNALKKSNIEDEIYHLSSYASAIATMDSDSKNLGTMVLDMGATQCEFIVFKDKGLLYNDAILLGSDHLTNDISMILKTPKQSAEKIKKEYASLLEIIDYDPKQSTKIKIPLIGNESLQEEISCDYIQKITHARTEEIFSLIQQKLLHNGVYKNINTIILTGGYSKLPGIVFLAREVFKGIHIQIKNPKNIQNGYINFNDPCNSTINGLILHGLQKEPSFELDSRRNLRGEIVSNLNNQKTSPLIILQEEISSIKEPSKNLV